MNCFIVVKKKKKITVQTQVTSLPIHYIHSNIVYKRIEALHSQ